MSLIQVFNCSRGEKDELIVDYKIFPDGASPFDSYKIEYRLNGGVWYELLYSFGISASTEKLIEPKIIRPHWGYEIRIRLFDSNNFILDEQVKVINPAAEKEVKIINKSSFNYSDLKEGESVNLLVDSKRERTSDSKSGSGYIEYKLIDEVSHIYGEDLTLSFQIKSEGMGEVRDEYMIYFLAEDDIQNLDLKPLQIRYNKETQGFKMINDDSVKSIIFKNDTGSFPDNDGVLHIKEVKLEYGINHNPVWTPHPDDYEGKETAYRRVEVRIK